MIQFHNMLHLVRALLALTLVERQPPPCDLGSLHGNCSHSQEREQRAAEGSENIARDHFGDGGNNLMS